jgi:hypothetical protein
MCMQQYLHSPVHVRRVILIDFFLDIWKIYIFNIGNYLEKYIIEMSAVVSVLMSWRRYLTSETDSMPSFFVNLYLSLILPKFVLSFLFLFQNSFISFLFMTYPVSFPFLLFILLSSLSVHYLCLFISKLPPSLSFHGTLCFFSFFFSSFSSLFIF